MATGTTSAATKPAGEQWRLPPVLLPDGERRDLWISDGHLTDVPADGAEVLPGRFALPGLVDAHAHSAISPGFEPLDAAGARDAGGRSSTGWLPRRPFEPLDAAGARDALVRWRDEGVLLVRDLGAPRSVTLEIAPDPALPRLTVAGRWLAPKGRFFAALHDPVPAEQLINAALAEVARGAGWVKVIADWTDPELSYDPALLRQLVEAAHAAGARVAAHSQWTGVREVVGAGVDSVEHGCDLDADTLATMAARDVAWTPTLTALAQPLPADAPVERRERNARWLANDRALVPFAAAHGVTILAGTDAAGTLVDEIRHLIAFGLTPLQALRAATTDARTFLGLPSLRGGNPADVVTFEADPRDDPAVLAEPAAVVLGGVRVR